MKSLKLEFVSGGKAKQVNDDLSTVKGEDNSKEQENETKDEWEELLPVDNLETAEEQKEAEKTEEKEIRAENVKLRVEDVKTARELRDVIPFSNSHVIKDIARKPFVARVVLFLEEHGYSSFPEISEALDIQYGSLWLTFDKLKKAGFPVVKINKHEQFNKRIAYYDLRRTGGQEDLKKILKELRVWYEYYSLKAFMKALPEYKWVALEELNKDYNFMILVKRYGYDFEGAIQLLSKNGVIYVKGQGKIFTHVKRAFDNYGARSEIEARDLIGS